MLKIRLAVGETPHFFNGHDAFVHFRVLMIPKVRHSLFILLDALLRSHQLSLDSFQPLKYWMAALLPNWKYSVLCWPFSLLHPGQLALRTMERGSSEGFRIKAPLVGSLNEASIGTDKIFFVEYYGASAGPKKKLSKPACVWCPWRKFITQEKFSLNCCTMFILGYTVSNHQITFSNVEKLYDQCEANNDNHVVKLVSEFNWCTLKRNTSKQKHIF